MRFGFGKIGIGNRAEGDKKYLKIIPLLFAAMILQACSDNFSWNQKITIVVETPDGIKIGSAVTHVEWNENIQFLPSINPFTSEVRGEAVVVDLGEGQYLFALIKNAPTIAMHTYAEMPKGPYGSQALKSRASAVVKSDGEKREVPKSGYPMFVTFGDIKKPETVKKVDIDNLAINFDGDYSLKEIILEITDEPVTEGRVEAVLDWLIEAQFLIPPKLQPRYADEQTVEQRLMPSNFIDWRSLKVKRETSN